MLEIKDLHVEVDGKQIIDGLSLTVGAGEVHAIMGPNGSGKSTLAFVLAGRPGYEVTGGSVTFDGQDLLALEPEERAAVGRVPRHAVPGRDPGRGEHVLPAPGDERPAPGARRGRDRRRRVHEAPARQGRRWSASARSC